MTQYTPAEGEDTAAGNMAVDDDDLVAELAGLTTEASRPDLDDLDRLPAIALVRLMNAEDSHVPAAVATCEHAIATAAEGIADRLGRGGRLIYAGAGTAGRIGVLDASECPPTFSTPPGQVVGLIAGGPRAVTDAIEGAEDNADAGADALTAIDVGPLDTVVGISASGRTPFVIGALVAAREAGAFTVAVACNENSRSGAIADVAIEVVVGPEVVAGSTRLKAGTAQKLVVNMLSTIAMIRLGKTYGNLMVDMRATNAKLRARAHRIVALATGGSEDEVAAALGDANGDVKTAILMLATGTGREIASRALRDAQGRLRHAMAALATP
jgi:N-acetylmuramic acid 6-phosphate etherase